LNVFLYNIVVVAMNIYRIRKEGYLCLRLRRTALQKRDLS